MEENKVPQEPDHEDTPVPKREQPRRFLSEEALRRAIQALKGPKQTDDDMFVGDLPTEMPDRFLKK